MALTAQEVFAIQRRHAGYPGGWCPEDGQQVPCEATRLAEALISTGRIERRRNYWTCPCRARNRIGSSVCAVCGARRAV